MTLRTRLQKSRPHPSPEAALQRAREYGVTHEPEHARFILPGGEMVGQEGDLHDDVAAHALDVPTREHGTTARFMKHTGAVRCDFSPDQTWVEAHGPITEAQRSTILRQHPRRAEFGIDTHHAGGIRSSHSPIALSHHISRHIDESNARFGIPYPIRKALVYNPKTGESEGTVQHKGKTLRFAAPTLGNRLKAFVGGEKFMPSRPLPAGRLTPHALSQGLSGVHSTMRGLGLHYHSQLAPVAGLKHTEFTHVISSPHNSAGASVLALHKQLSATHKVTAPAWTGRHWGFSATAQDGTRHHFVGQENTHVAAVHAGFAALGNVRARTGQSAGGSAGHHYTHEVKTAFPSQARDVFGQHFANQGFRVRKAGGGLNMTHPITGVRHKITFTHDASMAAGSQSAPPPPSQKKPVSRAA